MKGFGGMCVCDYVSNQKSKSPFRDVPKQQAIETLGS